jgi:hypothetical protein
VTACCGIDVTVFGHLNCRPSPELARLEAMRPAMVPDDLEPEPACNAACAAGHALPSPLQVRLEVTADPRPPLDAIGRLQRRLRLIRTSATTPGGTT